MIPIPDDPIVSCMERTGYPPWWDYYDEENDTDDDEEDEDALELFRAPEAL